MLCVFSGLTGDEQQLDNVIMHVDEEVRLLEEMAETERYFEHVFNNFENDGIDREIVMIKEAEDTKMKVCNDNQNEISLVENQNESIMEIVKEYMMMLTDAEVQEFYYFKVDYFMNL